MVARAARPAGRGVGRLRHRLPDGAHDRARGGAPARARPGGLGSRSATACRAPRRIRVLVGAGAPRHGRPRASLPRDRHRRRSSRSTADGQGRMQWRTLRAALEAAARGRRSSARRPGTSTAAPSIRSTRSRRVRGRGRLAARRRRLRLWAAASPRFRHLVAGSERADSWATDGHKWLNVPYDSGIAFCAHPEAHRAAMAVQASYLEQVDADGRSAIRWTGRRSSRAGRAASRLRGAPCARGAASRSWSSAAATTPPLRGVARRGARGRDPERGRPQPGARPLRRRRRDDASDGRARAGGRHLLALAARIGSGKRGDADLGLQLARRPTPTSSGAPLRS